MDRKRHKHSHQRADSAAPADSRVDDWNLVRLNMKTRQRTVLTPTHLLNVTETSYKCNDFDLVPRDADVKTMEVFGGLDAASETKRKNVRTSLKLFPNLHVLRLNLVFFRLDTSFQLPDTLVELDMKYSQLDALCLETSLPNLQYLRTNMGIEAGSMRRWLCRSRLVLLSLSYEHDCTVHLDFHGMQSLKVLECSHTRVVSVSNTDSLTALEKVSMIGQPSRPFWEAAFKSGLRCALHTVAIDDFEGLFEMFLASDVSETALRGVRSLKIENLAVHEPHIRDRFLGLFPKLDKMTVWDGADLFESATVPRRAKLCCSYVPKSGFPRNIVDVKLLGSFELKNPQVGPEVLRSQHIRVLSMRHVDWDLCSCIAMPSLDTLILQTDAPVSWLPSPEQCPNLARVVVEAIRNPFPDRPLKLDYGVTAASDVPRNGESDPDPLPGRPHGVTSLCVSSVLEKLSPGLWPFVFKDVTDLTVTAPEVSLARLRDSFPALEGLVLTGQSISDGSALSCFPETLKRLTIRVQKINWFDNAENMRFLDAVKDFRDVHVSTEDIVSCKGLSQKYK